MNQAPAGAKASDHKLILGSRVQGTPVFDATGERIGHVDDLSIERRSGRIVYAIMSFGGFLGIGERFHPIPWSLLDFDPGQGGYVVSLDRATLEDAPQYERDELVSLGGSNERRHDERIFEYYGPFGPLPYW